MRTPRIATTALALLLLTASSAMAAPGDLDPSFDLDGKLSIDAGGIDQLSAVAVQPDGRIVFTGGSDNSPDDRPRVYRLNPNGTPDLTFDGDGSATVPDPAFLQVSDLALQPDGKILLAGHAITGGNVVDDAAVYRLRENGSLDDSFGGGDGSVWLNTGQVDDAYAIALAPDGRIVVGGMTSKNDAATVHRLTPQGEPDNSFDGDGTVEKDLGSHERTEDVAVQPDGSVVVVGSASGNGGYGYIHRLTPAGKPDDTFNGGTDVIVDDGGYEGLTSVLVEPDGHVVAVGTTMKGTTVDTVRDDVLVVRLDSKGLPDAGFNGGGKAVIDNRRYDFGLDVARQPDGRLLVAGQTRTGLNQDAAIYRLDLDGTLDESFGEQGVAEIDDGEDASVGSVALYGDGRILAGGGDGDFKLYRLLGDPAAAPTPAPAAASAPVVRITKAPKRRRTIAGRKARVRVAFSADQPGASFECSVDRKRFRPCSSPAKLTLRRGKHRFRVRAVNENGTGPVAAVRFRLVRKR